jgi:hypothetical protein
MRFLTDECTNPRVTHELCVGAQIFSRKEALLEVLQDSEFRQTIQKLPGYDVEPMGKLIASLEGRKN